MNRKTLARDWLIRQYIASPNFFRTNLAIILSRNQIEKLSLPCFYLVSTRIGQSKTVCKPLGQSPGVAVYLNSHICKNGMYNGVIGVEHYMLYDDSVRLHGDSFCLNHSFHVCTWKVYLFTAVHLISNTGRIKILFSRGTSGNQRRWYKSCIDCSTVVSRYISVWRDFRSTDSQVKCLLTQVNSLGFCRVDYSVGS